MTEKQPKAIVPVQRGLAQVGEFLVKAPPFTQADYEAVKFIMALDKHHLRMFQFTRFLRATGVRLAEGLRLTPAHLERFPSSFGMVTCFLVRRGKKRQRQGVKVPVFERIPVHPEVAADLWGIIAADGIESGDRVWRFGPRQFQRVFKDAAIKALGRPATPHDLRRLYARSTQRQTGDTELTREMLGHESVRTTEGYLQAEPLEQLEVNWRQKV